MPQIQKTKKTKESAKSMKNIIQMSAFLQNRKIPKTEIFVFCVIIHEPIKIQTCSAPQNDRMNFVFIWFS